jgi:hypothetical protein
VPFSRVIRRFWDNGGMTQEIILTRPDDWHLHVRDGEALNTVVPHTAAQFGRAIIMPNLKPPVTTAAQALAYRDRIRAALPAGVNFEPLMTLVPDRQLAGRRNPAGQRCWRGRRQVVPCRRHDQQRRGRDRPAQDVQNAGSDAAPACCCWCMAR